MTTHTLKQTRTAYRLTQREMAQLMGMRQHAYSRIETGDREATQQQQATVRLIDELGKRGLLGKLLSEEQ